jgi:DNA-binding IclR family transcriptional regulator
MDRDPISKLLRALRWLVETPAPSTGVRELAAALDLPPSGAHRLLARLADEGMARQDDTGRYALGVEFYRLANLAAAKAPIRQASLGPMRRLVDACNETALLGIYDRSRHEMIFVATVESTHELRVVTPLNRWMPLHDGPPGLAILAFLEPDDVGQPAPLHLEGELARVRAQGWASTRGRHTAGTAGLAAPIFDARGMVVAAIALRIPEQRLDVDSEPAFVAHLTTCTRAISAALCGQTGRKANGTDRIEANSIEGRV